MEEGYEESNARSSDPAAIAHLRHSCDADMCTSAAIFVRYLESQCDEYIRLQEIISLEYPQQPPEISLFHSLQVPSFAIKDYVCRIARYARCSEECFILALLLLHRYQFFTGISIAPRNAHRLTITAVLVSTKSRDDVFFSNDYFSSIGGLRCEEMCSLERRFLQDIQWSTYVDWDEYQKCLLELRKRMPEYFFEAGENPPIRDNTNEEEK